MSNTRLDPAAMFDWAFMNIHEELEEKKPTITPLADSESESYGVKFKLPNQSIFLLAPITDADTIKPGINVGTVLAGPTKKWLEELKQQNDKTNDEKKFAEEKISKTFIIPFAESVGRQHWTLLICQNDNWFFYDPKNKKIFDYSLEFLETNLNIKIDKDQNKKHLGWQNVWDDSYCGYFTGHAIKHCTQQIAKNGPLNLSDVNPPDPLYLLCRYNSSLEKRDALYKEYKINDTIGIKRSNAVGGEKEPAPGVGTRIWNYLKGIGVGGVVGGIVGFAVGSLLTAVSFGFGIATLPSCVGLGAAAGSYIGYKIAGLTTTPNDSSKSISQDIQEEEEEEKEDYEIIPRNNDNGNKSSTAEISQRANFSLSPSHDNLLYLSEQQNNPNHRVVVDDTTTNTYDLTSPSSPSSSRNNSNPSSRKSSF